VNSRNQSLDVLRGIAMLLVLGRHFNYFPLWRRAGWIGVDLFFVLSGFLISGLLFQEYKNTGRLDVRRFILRRGLKIWPSYYLLILATMLFYVFIARASEHPFPKHEVAVSALFIRNYFGADGFNFLAHTWSLAVEEHFYLLLPLLLLMLIRLRALRLIPWLFTLLAIGCLALRFWIPQTPFAWATHLRMDGLFAGVALGYLYHFRKKAFRWLTGHYALIICAFCIAPAFVLQPESRFMQTAGLSLLMIGFTFLVAWSVVRSSQNVPTHLLARIGFYSYSIYLWHFLFSRLFNMFFPASLIGFLTGISGAIVCGSAAACMIEVPVLTLREHWLPSLSKPLIYAAPRRPVSSEGNKSHHLCLHWEHSGILDLRKQ